jgi:two-component system response regulator FlrC
MAIAGIFLDKEKIACFIKLNEVQGVALSLLVVEDEEDISLMLQDRLMFLGFYVTVAGNGAEGMAILERMAVDGILMDIQMPVMDGLTMLKQVKEQYPNIPVIAMSAELNKDKLIQAIELGANDYLLKPIDADLLAKKCSQIFSSYVDQQQLDPS